MHVFPAELLNRVIDEIQSRHRDGYEGVIKRTIEQLRVFFENVHPNEKMVIGISGGIDSTVVAALAKQAIGSQRLILLYLPARNDDEGETYFPIVKEYIGATEAYQLPVDTLVHSMVTTVQNVVGHTLDEITKGNIAARLRVNLFYAVAREQKGIVLGTSNRTEFVQGYATKFGTPMSCDYGVLDTLYKTDVVNIAQSLNVPEAIITRQPSTGFFMGQTHEEELGATLQEQDVAAYLLFEKNLSVDEIVQTYGASKEYLVAFVQRHNASAHKRMLQVDHVTIGDLS